MFLSKMRSFTVINIVQKNDINTDCQQILVHWIVSKRAKDAKEKVRYKWVFIATELLNTTVNDFGAKKSARCMTGYSP